MINGTKDNGSRKPMRDRSLAGISSKKIYSKREMFLAYLKSQYGYTNEKSVDELERLLKQFYRMNESYGIHGERPFVKRLDID